MKTYLSIKQQRGWEKHMWVSFMCKLLPQQNSSSCYIKIQSPFGKLMQVVWCNKRNDQIEGDRNSISSGIIRSWSTQKKESRWEKAHYITLEEAVQHTAVSSGVKWMYMKGKWCVSVIVVVGTGCGWYKVWSCVSILCAKSKTAAFPTEAFMV